MPTFTPFRDFIIDLSTTQLPLTIEHWKSIYQEHFKNSKVYTGKQLDVQLSLCDSYRIDMDAVVEYSFGTMQDHITSPFSSILFNSDNLFYLLIQFQDNYLIFNACNNFFKEAGTEFFSYLGGGRFRSLRNGIIVSFEQDEFDQYFILITSKQGLITFDDLFVFARQLLKSKIG